MNICLGEPIGLIHAYRQIYYQNKAMLRNNFSSVYDDFFVIEVKYFVQYIVKCICHVLAHNVGTVSESAHERVIITWRIRGYVVSCILKPTLSL